MCGYPTVKKIGWYNLAFRHSTGVWRTDRQTGSTVGAMRRIGRQKSLVNVNTSKRIRVLMVSWRRWVTHRHVDGLYSGHGSVVLLTHSAIVSFSVLYSQCLCVGLGTARRTAHAASPPPATAFSPTDNYANYVIVGLRTRCTRKVTHLQRAPVWCQVKANFH